MTAGGSNASISAQGKVGLANRQAITPTHGHDSSRKHRRDRYKTEPNRYYFVQGVTVLGALSFA